MVLFFSPGEIEGLKSQVEKTQVGVEFRCLNNKYMMVLIGTYTGLSTVCSVYLVDAAPGHFQMNHGE